MKIQIKSLHVVDCGPIKDAVFHFDDENGVPRDTTLMTGANGSGKTTILKLIIALSEAILSIESPTRPIDLLNTEWTSSYASFLRNVGYARMDLLIDGEHFYFAQGDRDYESVGFAGIGTRIKGTRDPITSEPDITVQGIVRKIRIQRRKHYPVLELDVAANSPDLTPSVLYFPQHRELPHIDGQRIEQEETRYEWVYEYKTSSEYQGSLNSYLIWLDYAHPDQFLAAKAVMDSLYPDEKRFEIDRPRLKVIVRLRDGGTHDLEELSSGEQNILITLIELRRRLIPGSIVLIDEIENSLHQDAQFRFGFAIKALQKQIPFQLIATSHVNTFSRIFGYENLLVLPAPGTHGRQRQAAIK